MTVTTHSPRSRRRLDLASLGLLLIGLVFGFIAYWLISEHGRSPLLLAPAVVAATLGASHITKREVPRR